MTPASHVPLDFADVFRWECLPSGCAWDDREEFVPDARGALTPSQLVDAKLFALMGDEAEPPRDTKPVSLNDRALTKPMEA